MQIDHFPLIEILRLRRLNLGTKNFAARVCKLFALHCKRFSTLKARACMSHQAQAARVSFLIFLKGALSRSHPFCSKLDQLQDQLLTPRPKPESCRIVGVRPHRGLSSCCTSACDTHYVLFPCSWVKVSLCVCGSSCVSTAAVFTPSDAEAPLHIYSFCYLFSIVA